MQSQAETYRDKIKKFINDTKVKDIVILGTGPSLEKGINYIKSNPRDDLIIISIKQSFLKISNYEGKIFHLINPWNLEKYNYSRRNILRLYFHEQFVKFKLNKKYYDLFFLTEFIDNHLENSVLKKENFEDWLYSNSKMFSHKRPVMPGIFGEALYLALFIGCENIRLFGVDYTFSNGVGNEHFYDLPNFLNKFLKLISRLSIVQKIFFILGMRTQYSHALKNELSIAIPGYTKFIKYINNVHSINVYGWNH